MPLSLLKYIAQLCFKHGRANLCQESVLVSPYNELLQLEACSSQHDSHFDVKDAPRTGRAVVEIIEKIAEIIQVDRHVSSRSIAQELQIDHETVLNFAQSWIQKEARCLGATPINTKKHN
ncbi:hypothetical protein TNCV_1122931 [Trichonephila clavipes]|uniref:Uncharacterized protein n=1 Tax=Trichonephila clavipes TaxID=2585209 RepID=A0A8X6SGH6_TRICX|nr:hypothetical protein TNCV_1122931 [Trichonephila clavipes]